MEKREGGKVADLDVVVVLVFRSVTSHPPVIGSLHRGSFTEAQSVFLPQKQCVFQKQSVFLQQMATSGQKKGTMCVRFSRTRGWSAGWGVPGKVKCQS